ncbi:hypothetical protein [Sulfuricurvum sp.]|uniref:hypothetical protein n=1 Tax=Sulfuricurvum sp. TaxID=2025608 RepID=UPI0026157FF7|nr:hypothetical protein [Sulfuricurvum sp.]MDD3596744.1 hypothetical protein [Sulfuricurvum sp.]
MSVISQGFTTQYAINKVGTIKPGGHGKMDNGNPYGASVKFRSQNIVEREDQQVGLKEVETNIEIKIPCESDSQASLVSEALRKLRDSGVTFTISADLPMTHENGKKKDVATVTSFDNGSEFLKKFESITKIKEAPKVS